jgi:hypothetical protein
VIGLPEKIVAVRESRTAARLPHAFVADDERVRRLFGLTPP